jgi:HD superfamily phosphohydrolase
LNGKKCYVLITYPFNRLCEVKMTNNTFKIIQDPINGPVKVPYNLQMIIDTPEFQRLRYIRQLGMCHLVFPGANHTRFEHSLGSMYLAQMFADTLEIEERDLFIVASLLHDIGHPPLSHGAEETFEKITGLDHLHAGVKIILGQGDFSGSSIPGVLEGIGISPHDIADVLLFKSRSKRLISRLVSGPIDVDELDYLRRDAMYTGVAMGNVDHRRILNVAKIVGDDVAIEEKGIGTLESILISRILMYSSVYFHKTSRIAQIMSAYAIDQNIDKFRHPFSMTDNDFYSIISHDTSMISTQIMNRNLHKPVLRFHYTPELLTLIKDALIKSDLEEWEYIIDVIPPLDFAGPGRVKSDMNVLSNNELADVTSLSPLIRTLRETLEKKSIIVSSRLARIYRVKELLETIH